MKKKIISLVYLIALSIQIQIPLQLRGQIYQYPLNIEHYRMLVEVEKPAESLAVPVVSVEIGTPGQRVNLIYSTASHAIITLSQNSITLGQSPFNLNETTSGEKLEEYSLEYNAFTFGSLNSVFRDVINITPDGGDNTVYLKFFNSYHFSPNTMLADGELGLMKKYSSLFTDPYVIKEAGDFSLMSQLLKNGKIKKNIFAHKYEKGGKGKGTLYIGEEPEGDFSYYTCKGKGKGDLSQYWNCFIDKITIDGKEYKLGGDSDDSSKYAAFSTSEKFIFVPESHKDILLKYQEHSQWSRDNCVIDNHVAFSELHCDFRSFTYSHFPTMRITIGGFEIVLRPEDVFYYNYNNKYFRLIILSTTKRDFFIIGSPALRKYNMIFDGENDSVSFFTKRKSNPLFLFLGIMGSLLVIAGVGVYLRRKFNRKKNTLQEYYDLAKN